MYRVLWLRDINLFMIRLMKLHKFSIKKKTSCEWNPKYIKYPDQMSTCTAAYIPCPFVKPETPNTINIVHVISIFGRLA